MTAFSKVLFLLVAWLGGSVAIAAGVTALGEGDNTVLLLGAGFIYGIVVLCPLALFLFEGEL